MKLINLMPLQEIDFPNQKSFDDYNRVHKLRPDTKVTVAGRVTTAGRASQNSKPVKGTSIFSKDAEKNAQSALANDKESSFKVSYLDDKGERQIANTFKSQEDAEDYAKYFSSSSKVKVEPSVDNAPDASLNGTSALNKPKPKDLVSSVENHLNKVSGGEGYAQTDDGSGAIVYNMGNGDMPTYTLYMGKEGNKHRVTLEPTYGNDPKKLQGKIDKSFDKVQDAIKFMGDVAKRYRKELEMDDNSGTDGNAKKKPVPQDNDVFDGGVDVIDTVSDLLPPGTGFTHKKTGNEIIVKGYKDNHMLVSYEKYPNKTLKWPLKQFFKLVANKDLQFRPKSK